MDYNFSILLSLRAMNKNFNILINLLWLTVAPWNIIFCRILKLPLKSLGRMFVMVRNVCSTRKEDSGVGLCHIFHNLDLSYAEQFLRHIKSIPSINQGVVKSKPRAFASHTCRTCTENPGTDMGPFSNLTGSVTEKAE